MRVEGAELQFMSGTLKKTIDLPLAEVNAGEKINILSLQWVYNYHVNLLDFPRITEYFWSAEKCSDIFIPLSQILKFDFTWIIVI